MQRLHAREDLLAPGRRFTHLIRVGAACVRSLAVALVASSSPFSRMSASDALIELALSANFSRSTMSRRSSTIRSLAEDLCQSLRRLDAVEFEEKCIAAWGRFAAGNA